MTAYTAGPSRRPSDYAGRARDAAAAKEVTALAANVEQDRIWNETFDAYHRTGSTIEGAMSRADDAVRHWKESAR